MRVLILEPDRIVAECISDELKRRNIQVSIATTADRAINLADAHTPDAVIAELSLPGHSGSEFMYEFRTYEEWRDIPIVIYSTLKPTKTVQDSNDWALLGIHSYMYKPDFTIQVLADAIESIE